MTETLTGTNRSGGVAYTQLLREDSHPVPDYLLRDSPIEEGEPTLVPVERYTSREWHDLEVENLWKRVWQMACHEDDIPDVGDYLVYDIVGLSFLVVRVAEEEFKAYYNACLHRGRLLRQEDGKRARDLRCAFHGWTRNLDGSLKEIPCQWDFPYVDPEEQSLPEVKVGRWGGFVFINPDEDAEPFEDFVDDLASHFTNLPYEKRYKEAHVAKILRCNWKVAQEAFMEAYHVVATHPQILAGICDANSKYDVFGNYSRAITPNGVPSPHLSNVPQEEPLADSGPFKMRHPLSGAIHDIQDDGCVLVTNKDGRSGKFTEGGVWLEGDLGESDPHMCQWLAGRQLDYDDAAWQRRRGSGNGDGAAAPRDGSVREIGAAAIREGLRATLGDLMDQIPDAELNDSIYFTLFPNFHPWGSFNRIVYRFRPNGNNPDESIMECLYLSPVCAGRGASPGCPDPLDRRGRRLDRGAGAGDARTRLQPGHVQPPARAARPPHHEEGRGPVRELRRDEGSPLPPAARELGSARVGAEGWRCTGRLRHHGGVPRNKRPEEGAHPQPPPKPVLPPPSERPPHVTTKGYPREFPPPQTRPSDD